MSMRKAIGGLKSIPARAAITCVAVLNLAPAQAHHVSDFAAPTTFGAGLLSGLGHPVIGLGSLLFLLAVGLWCSPSAPKLSRPPLIGLPPGSLRRLTLPGLLLGSMVGGILDAAGMEIAVDDLLVAISVCGGGLLLLATRQQLSRGAALCATLAVSIGAITHGVVAAEGSAGATGGPLLAYWIGILSMQSTLFLAAYYAAGILATRLPRAVEHTRVAAGILLLLAGGALVIAPGIGQLI
ncbi:MAG: HupE/UreJ family protein [Lautropia sp.]